MKGPSDEMVGHCNRALISGNIADKLENYKKRGIETLIMVTQIRPDF